MLRIEITKPVNRKWLTVELQEAGVRVDTVAYDDGIGYADIHEDDESLALPVIEVHDPTNTPDIHERNNLANMYQDIESELTWLSEAIPRVVQLKAIFDSSTSTQAQVKAAASGLCELLERMLREQKREFGDGWKYVVRRLR